MIVLMGDLNAKVGKDNKSRKEVIWSRKYERQRGATM